VPRVSVILTVYNGEAFLPQAIESIIEQEFDDFEFLIINDGSKDRSAQIIQAFTDPRIRYYENPRNIGRPCSLNRGLSLSRSPYIAPMDADDISLRQRLGKQVSFLDHHPEIGVISSSVQLIDGQGKPIGRRQYPLQPPLVRWSLCLFDPIAHPAAMMRRDVVEQVGGYREEMTTAEDYDLWRRLSSVTQLANLPSTLLSLRRHGANATAVRLAEHKRNRVQVSQLMICEYLDDIVTAETVHHIWDRTCETVEEVREAAALVRRILKRGLQTERISKPEQTYMIRYAANKLLGLAYRRTSNGRATDIIASACLLDPLVIARATAKRSRRLIRRPVVS